MKNNILIKRISKLGFYISIALLLNSFICFQSGNSNPHYENSKKKGNNKEKVSIKIYSVNLTDSLGNIQNLDLNKDLIFQSNKFSDIVDIYGSTKFKLGLRFKVKSKKRLALFDFKCLVTESYFYYQKAGTNEWSFISKSKIEECDLPVEKRYVESKCTTLSTTIKFYLGLNKYTYDVKVKLLNKYRIK